MNGNYWKLAFEKLAGQIRLERSWAEEDDDSSRRTFKEGMCFAYFSMEQTVKFLEKGDFEFEEKEVSEDDEEDWG